MNNLHAIFRAKPDGSSWEAYSRPVSIHAGGTSLEAARDEFGRAAEFHFEEEWPNVNVVTHVERQVVPGVFARTALDRFVAQRDYDVDVLTGALGNPRELEHLRRSATTLASTGDIVFVCCVAGDLIDWVIGQLGRTEALQVCTTVAENGLWWTTLAAPFSTYGGDDTETLEDAGLLHDGATVGDLMPSEGRYSGPAKDDVMTGGRTLVVSR